MFPGSGPSLPPPLPFPPSTSLLNYLIPSTRVPPAMHTGMLIEAADVVIWAVECGVFNLSPRSTPEQRQQAKREAEKAMLENSFFF
jgi:hypothetical protein